MSSTLAARPRMTADEFIAWSIGRPETEHYELEDGEVIAMAAERAIHARVKLAIVFQLMTALKAAGIEGDVFGDGMAVRIDDFTVYEPDALLRLGPRVADDTVEIADPVIVVEVTSPSSSTRDATSKLANYFRLPSLRHYVIADPRRRRVLHFRRETEVVMRVIGDDALSLDVAGATLAVRDLFVLSVGNGP